jgi:hypothetical protein
MEYKAKGHEGGSASGGSKKPVRTERMKNKAASVAAKSMNGLLVLSTKGFARFEACMKNPGEPTEANRRGASLLRNLYSNKSR